MRIYPDADDRATITRFLGHARKIYNDALECMKTERVYKEFGTDGLKCRFSSVVIGGSKNAYFERFPFLEELPATSRKYAVKDLMQAFQTNRAKQKKDPKHRFELKFRSKRGAQTLRIEACAVKRLGGGRVKLFPRSKEMTAPGVGVSEKNMVDVVSDVTVQKDAMGRYWLLVPYHTAPENQGGGDGCCAIDPGVRTFATVYDPDGGLTKFGDGASCRVFKLLLHLDALLSKRAEWASRVGKSKKCAKPYKSRRRLDGAISRLRERVKNLVKELHWKVADELTKRYGTIVIPPFETKDMASTKRGRKLRKKSVRQMLGMSHYAFRVRLEHKAASRGREVRVMGEEYTSKTCTMCGVVDANLGGAKTYRCRSCGAVYDRDGGAARNIFIKNYIMKPFGAMPR